MARDGSFVAEVEAPDPPDYAPLIRYGERMFYQYAPERFIEINYFTAPTEGALVVEP